MDTYAYLWIPTSMVIFYSEASPIREAACEVLKRLPEPLPLCCMMFICHSQIRGLSEAYQGGTAHQTERPPALTSTPSFCKSLIVALPNSMKTRFFVWAPQEQKNNRKSTAEFQTHQLQTSKLQAFHSFFPQIAAPFLVAPYWLGSKKNLPKTPCFSPQKSSPKRPKRHPPVGWPVGAFKPWTSQFKTMSWRTVAAMLLGTKSEGNEQSRHLYKKYLIWLVEFGRKSLFFDLLFTLL